GHVRAAPRERIGRLDLALLVLRDLLKRTRGLRLIEQLGGRLLRDLRRLLEAIRRLDLILDGVILLGSRGNLLVDTRDEPFVAEIDRLGDPARLAREELAHERERSADVRDRVVAAERLGLLELDAAGLRDLRRILARGPRLAVLLRGGLRRLLGAIVADGLRDLLAHLVERLLALLVHLLDADQVKAERALHDAAHLARLQGERRLLEGLHHAALREEPEIAALLRRTLVLRLLARELLEVGAVLHLLLDVGDLLAGGVARRRVGVL